MKDTNLVDLQKAAKGAKNGTTFYGYLKIYWDDATNSFTYQYKARNCNEQMVKDILNMMAE